MCEPRPRITPSLEATALLELLFASPNGGFYLYVNNQILLTARPGAWRGSRFRRGLLFFLVLSVTRPSPSLGQVLVGTLNHATCNVYSPKAFETLIHENVTHIVFFIVSEIYFLFVLSKCSIQSERTCQNVQGLRHW